MPLKNIINEAYAIDISRKLSRKQGKQMRDGDYLGQDQYTAIERQKRLS